MTRRKRNGGFTLIELIAVVAVASIALVATAGAVATGAKLTRTVAEERAGLRASAALMEQVRATPFDQILATYNGTSRSAASLGAGDCAGTTSATVVEVPTGSTRWRCYEVTVTTNWSGSAGGARESIATYVSDRVNR